ncbi:hypothetical protein Nepgr_018838 [Nepenthes gracilis]|uniref:Uncharacterized protein n=1 Tax=Nepenthes gracilis TaxID=150966 RepID=A0AAD3SUU1_NEPGR|nr:hypothetical protein Nepgr_018838 [Nepenthes gracilis]
MSPQSVDPHRENPSPFNPTASSPLSVACIASVSPLLVHPKGSMPLNSSEAFSVNPIPLEASIVNAASPLFMEQNLAYFGSRPSIESEDHA